MPLRYPVPAGSRLPARGRATVTRVTGEIIGTADCWDALAASSLTYYATGEQGRPGRDDRWFAAVSGLDHGELNVCGLMPGAGADDARSVAVRLEGDLPGIVFVSEHARPDATGPLTGAGFTIAAEVEPVPAAGRRPGRALHRPGPVLGR